MDREVEEGDIQLGLSSHFVTKTNHERSISPVVRQIASAVSVSSIGCVLGMAIAFSSVVLDAWKLEGDVDLTEGQISWFASVVQLVSIPGSLLGGSLAQLLGPRRLLFCLLPLLALTWPVFLLLRQYPTRLIALRAFQGVLTSASSVCVYVYPCEVSEAKRRGTLGSLPEAAFSLGFLLTSLLASLFHWTTLVLTMPFTFAPCIISLTLTPQSPIWLLQKGKLEDAKETLRGLRPVGHDVEKELLDMQVAGSVGHFEREPYCENIRRLSKPYFWLPVSASIILLVLKECTGQLVLALFVVQIFRSANVGVSPQYSSVIVGTARFLSNMVCVFLLGRISRRKILITGSVVASLSVALLGVHFYGHSSEEDSSTLAPLLYLTIFTIAFGGGIGPVSYLMATELLPSSIRGLGSGIAGSASYAAQFGITFAAAQAPSVHLYISFWGYAAGCLALAGFVLLLPETKGISLQNLERYWSHRTSVLKVSHLSEGNNNEDIVCDSENNNGAYKHTIEQES